MDALSNQTAYLSDPQQNSAPAKLEIIGRDLSSSYTISKQKITVGSDQSSADVVLDYTFVSRKHFCIEYENGSYICKHTKSTNGLIYNGNQVAGNKEAEFLLQNNDIIRIGRFNIGNKNSNLVTLVFHYDEQSVSTNSPIKPYKIEFDKQKSVITIGSASDSDFKLSVHQQVAQYHAYLEKDDKGRHSIAPAGPYPVYVNSKKVKGKQQLERKDKIYIGKYTFIYDGGYLIEDDGTSSVCIRAKGLFKTEELRFPEKLKTMLRQKAPKKLKTMLRQKAPKELLHDISLAIPGGKLVALVGGSGAGKSTLMDALNGVRPTQEGIVFYNRENYYNAVADFNGQLGYVPQQDIVHLNLSVEDALYYGLKLRLPHDISKEEITERISAVLDEVKLTPSIIASVNGVFKETLTSETTIKIKEEIYERIITALDEDKVKLINSEIPSIIASINGVLKKPELIGLATAETIQEIKERITIALDKVKLAREDLLKQRIANLSGGQRKRVSIALELLSKPSIIFLDEPNSGLDPGLDYDLMFNLRKLADRGQTVVLVTHATNNINLCDYVCFLAKGGNLLYFGPPSDATSFFDVDEFVEIYQKLDSVNIERTKEDDNYQENQKYINHLFNICGKHAEKRPEKSTKPRQSSSWQQFKLLCMRYIKLLWNDKRYFALLLLQAPIIALLLVGFIKYGNDANGFDATNVVQCPGAAQFITVNSFPHKPVLSSPHTTSCSELENFLKTKTKTNKKVQAFVTKNGGARKALQQFIQPGPGDAPKILFLMAFAAFMFGCVNAAREIVKESDIYRREHGVGVGLLPYMFSKIVVLGVLCLLQSFFLVVIIAFSDHFYGGIILSGIIEVYLILLLTSWAGLMVGLTLSAIVETSEKATSFVPLLLLPQVIFSGTIFPLQDRFLQLFGMLSSVRWSMAALGSSVGLHSDAVPPQAQDKLLGNDYIYHGIVFSTYSQNDATKHLLLMGFALLLTIIILGFVIGCVLKLKYRNRAFSSSSKKSFPHLQFVPNDIKPKPAYKYHIYCLRCGRTFWNTHSFCSGCGQRLQP